MKSFIEYLKEESNLELKFDSLLKDNNYEFVDVYEFDVKWGDVKLHNFDYGDRKLVKLVKDFFKNNTETCRFKKIDNETMYIKFML